MMAENIESGNGIRSNKRHYFLIVCKVANVALCVLAFLMIFFSDMSLDIADDIEDYIGSKPKKGVYPNWIPDKKPDPAAEAAAKKAAADAAKAAAVPVSNSASGK